MAEPAAGQVAVLVARAATDGVAYSIALATIIKVLPPLAALVSILWIGFQFYHSEPMVRRRKRKEKKHGPI